MQCLMHAHKMKRSLVSLKMELKCILIFYFTYCLCVCVHVCRSLWRTDERVRLAGIEVKANVSHLTRTLGTKLGTSAGISSTLKCCVTSLAPRNIVLPLISQFNDNLKFDLTIMWEVFPILLWLQKYWWYRELVRLFIL